MARTVLQLDATSWFAFFRPNDSGAPPFDSLAVLTFIWYGDTNFQKGNPAERGNVVGLVWDQASNEIVDPATLPFFAGYFRDYDFNQSANLNRDQIRAALDSSVTVRDIDIRGLVTNKKLEMFTQILADREVRDALRAFLVQDL